MEGSETPSNRPTSQFLEVEYKEASTNFFRGVDIGLNYTRNFLLLNGMLFTSLGLSQSEMFLDFKFDAYLHLSIAIFGLFSAILLYSIVPFYDTQLRNCARRCAEIEHELGGTLYKNIVREIERPGRFTTTTGTVKIACLVLGAIWLSVIVMKLASIK
ncbi:MAG: hypothetical protein ACK4MV_05715 [Beijerinckiaceae bacterium]